jgi:hypothetical protein
MVARHAELVSFLLTECLLYGCACLHPACSLQYVCTLALPGLQHGVFVQCSAVSHTALWRLHRQRVVTVVVGRACWTVHGLCLVNAWPVVGVYDVWCQSKADRQGLCVEWRRVVWRCSLTSQVGCVSTHGCAVLGGECCSVQSRSPYHSAVCQQGALQPCCCACTIGK